MIGFRPKKRKAFTVVELLIVIAVIGILAVISIVSYAAVQKNVAANVIKSDLTQASTAMEASLQSSNVYPSTLPSSFSPSGDVSMNLTTTTLPHYSNLSTVQNGVLMAQICQDLVTQGYGNGLNASGATDNYVTGCGNWNAGNMQVTGWTSQKFYTPISSTTFPSYAASIPAGDSYHPNEQHVTQTFYNLLAYRFPLEGGTWPITSFWDSWATSTNGGVMKQDLPASDGSTSHFCITATSKKYPDVIWHIDETKVISSGTCTPQ